MWKYACITKKEFESAKDKIEKFIVLLGGIEVSIDLPYEQKTTSFIGSNAIVNISTRLVFHMI